jgi:hypothetical protein
MGKDLKLKRPFLVLKGFETECKFWLAFLQFWVAVCLPNT